MLSNCLKYRKNAGSKNLRFVKKINGRIMLSSNYVVCGNEKSILDPPSGLLSRLGIKIQILSK